MSELFTDTPKKLAVDFAGSSSVALCTEERTTNGDTSMNAKTFGLLVVAVSLSGLTNSAHATTVTTLVGSASGQSSTATADLDFNAEVNTIFFSVMNTSASTQPGSTSIITGIGFDLPPGGNASASGLNGFSGTQGGSSDFDFSDADLGNVPGFNSSVLDFGFVSGGGGNFSGGSMSLGLAPGSSAIFVVTGAAFTGFTEAQIASAMFLYFQSVPIFGVDVAVPGASPTPVPEPGTLALLGLGLAGLGLSCRRKAN